MVVYSAGGANDLLACVVSEHLGAALGQPFII
jgi:tripartite-type tricarboxylate transporter receptor subunit TctC